jgi:4-hydroxybenzoate polyprenyltransferase
VSVQIGNVIANFIYRTDDAPLYRRGNRDLVIVNVLAIAFFLFTKAYFVLRNRYRDRKWDAMTEEVRFLPLVQ